MSALCDSVCLSVCVGESGRWYVASTDIGSGTGFVIDVGCSVHFVGLSALFTSM